jgi:hypothetical protein
MKCDLLSLHPLNQFLDPIKHWLIRNAGSHLVVMVDLLVDLNALLTHLFTHPLGRRGNANRATCATHYKVRAILFLHRVIWPDNHRQETRVGVFKDEGRGSTKLTYALLQGNLYFESGKQPRLGLRVAPVPHKVVARQYTCQK